MTTQDTGLSRTRRQRIEQVREKRQERIRTAWRKFLRSRNARATEPAEGSMKPYWENEQHDLSIYCGDARNLSHAASGGGEA